MSFLCSLSTHILGIGEKRKGPPNTVHRVSMKEAKSKLQKYQGKLASEQKKFGSAKPEERAFFSEKVDKYQAKVEELEGVVANLVTQNQVTVARIRAYFYLTVFQIFESLSRILANIGILSRIFATPSQIFAPLL